MSVWAPLTPMLVGPGGWGVVPSTPARLRRGDTDTASGGSSDDAQCKKLLIDEQRPLRAGNLDAATIHHLRWQEHVLHRFDASKSASSRSKIECPRTRSAPDVQIEFVASDLLPIAV